MACSGAVKWPFCAVADRLKFPGDAFTGVTAVKINELMTNNVKNCRMCCLCTRCAWLSSTVQPPLSQCSMKNITRLLQVYYRPQTINTAQNPQPKSYLPLSKNIPVLYDVLLRNRFFNYLDMEIYTHVQLASPPSSRIIFQLYSTKSLVLRTIALQPHL